MKGAVRALIADADGVPCSPLHYTGQPSPALRLPPVQTSTPISSPRATVTSPSQQRGTTPDNDVTESPKTTPVTSNRPKIWSMAELASSKDDDKTSVGEDKEVPRLSGPLLASPHPAFTNRTDMYNLSKTGGAFSAFRPPHQAVPSQAPTSAPGHLLAAGHPGAVGGHLPRPGWPHALPPSHPAYSYALTQHYLAMTAAAAAAGQRAANPSGPMLNGVQTTAAAQLGHLQTAMLQAVAQQHAAAQEGSQRSDKDARDASPPAARGGAPQTEKRDSPQLTSHRLQQSPPSYSLHQSPPLQAFRHPLSSS